MKNKFFIIGMPGVGKTSVGKELSHILKLKFVDTDLMVEQLEGSSVYELFKNRGEQYFRNKESQVISVVASDVQPAVVALGGGAILNSINATLIKERGTIIWLRAGLETVRVRLLNDSKIIRPLLQSSFSENLSNLFEVRTRIYGDLADISVEVDTKTVQEIATAIQIALKIED